MIYPLFILFLFSTISLIGQSDNQLYEIKQYCNSESRLLPLIDKPVDDFKVIILFEPNACPRCESSFKVLNDYLLLAGIDFEYLVLSHKVSNNLSNMYDYLDAKLSNISKNDLSRIFKFYFSKDHIQVPFILKIDTNGKMVNSKAMLGINVDEDFVKEFVETSNDNCVQNVDNNNFRKFEKARLISCSQVFIGEQFDAFDYAQFYNTGNDKYAAIERASGNIQLIDFNIDSIYYTIQSSEIESYFFNSQIPGNVMKSLDDYNILKTIYLKILNANDSTFTVIASLPLVAEDSTGYGYYNQPVVLTKDWMGSILSIEEIDFPLEDSYVLKHAKTFSNNEDLTCYKLVKGWPAVGTKNQNDTKENLDINSDLFYSNAYEYNCICNDGKSFKLGALTELQKTLKIGYYFDYTGIQFYRNKIIYWNGIDGDINIFDINGCDLIRNTATKLNIFPNDFLTENCDLSETVNSLEDVQLREKCLPYRIKSMAYDFDEKIIFSIIEIDNIFSIQLNSLVDSKIISHVNLEVLKIDYVYDFYFIKKNNDFHLHLFYESNGKYYMSKFVLLQTK